MLTSLKTLILITVFCRPQFPQRNMGAGWNMLNALPPPSRAEEEQRKVQQQQQQQQQRLLLAERQRQEARQRAYYGSAPPPNPPPAAPSQVSTTHLKLLNVYISFIRNIVLQRS
jgi:transcription initiation factor TFIID subunit TAF12